VRRYTVIIERGSTSYGAYVPDLPGCIAAGETREEVEHLIREAIDEHLEALRAAGDPIPEPTSAAIEIDAAA
jgi:predicted RNase H-like HicB family nuclease